MSIESAKLFIDRIKNDEDFAKKVTACKDAEARKAFVSNEGFAFNEEEIEACKAELSDSELTRVVGGVSVCWGVGTENEPLR
jgi:predicted ribosomally synthesized peptide with nif11-like leader